MYAFIRLINRVNDNSHFTLTIIGFKQTSEKTHRKEPHSRADLMLLFVKVGLRAPNYKGPHLIPIDSSIHLFTPQTNHVVILKTTITPTLKTIKLLTAFD